MKKASEYRAHAEECRQLASKMDLGEQRDQLLGMARHWDGIVADVRLNVGELTAVSVVAGTLAVELPVVVPAVM